RVGAAAALIPAEGPRAGDARVHLDRSCDVLSLDRLRDILIIDPAIAMRRDLPIGGVHRGDRRRVAFQGHGDAVDGDRQVARSEGAMEPPEPGAAAIFVKRLHVHVAHPQRRLRADPFRQKGFPRPLALKDAGVAAPLWYMMQNLQAEAPLAGPAWVRRLAALAVILAGMASPHRPPPRFRAALKSCAGRPNRSFPTSPPRAKPVTPIQVRAGRRP